MSDEMEMVCGSGNVFRDFGNANADLEQLRAILAARIIGVLDDRKLTVRAAEAATGVAGAEFSRIRNVKLVRFTVDRLMTILGKLDQQVSVQLDVQPRRVAERGAPGVEGSGGAGAAGLRVLASPRQTRSAV